MATLLFFGKLQDIVGKSSETLSLPDAVTDTAKVRTFVEERFGLSKVLSETSVRVAVNSIIVIDPAPIADSDEIAFLPPVGGG